MARNVLLLTATVAPLAGIPSLARVDPSLRFRDYQTAFSFYTELLDTCFDAIIFAENSKFDLAALKASVASTPRAENIEFISFYGLDYPPEYGRGYGEFKLVDHSIATSKLLLPDDIVWKVTGRYIIQNIRRIVARRPPTADLYCHARNYPYRLCELYLLAWNCRGYRAVIQGIYPKLRNDVIQSRITMEETSFRNVIDSSMDTITVVPRFNVIPIVSGVRGWNNTPYSVKWSPKLIARRLAHLLVPSLWI